MGKIRRWGPQNGGCGVFISKRRRMPRDFTALLKATVQGLTVKESVLRTVLIEVESVLNSRPLKNNSCDTTDYTALTPYQFC